MDEQLLLFSKFSVALDLLCIFGGICDPDSIVKQANLINA